MKSWFLLFPVALLLLQACSAAPEKWNARVDDLFFGVRPGQNPDSQLQRFAAVPALKQDRNLFVFTRHPLLQTPFIEGYIEVDTLSWQREQRMRRSGVYVTDPYTMLQHMRFYFEGEADAKQAYDAFVSYLKPAADSAGEDDSKFAATSQLQKSYLFSHSKGSPIRYLYLVLSPVPNSPDQLRNGRLYRYMLNVLPSQAPFVSWSGQGR